MPGIGDSLVLVGAGSSVIVDFEETCRRLGITIAAIVRNHSAVSRALAADRVIEMDAITPALRDLPAAIPLFTPAYRQSALAQARGAGFSRFPALVDPTAIVAASAAIGEGSYVNAGAIVGGAARLGRFVFVNRGAQVGHHLQAEDFASIGPGAVVAGEVRLGRGAMIGAGAVVAPGRTIGANCVLSAGAVVTADLPANCLAGGNPARVWKEGVAGYHGAGVAGDPP